jgi:Flp pilus assembly protein TadG
VSRFLGSRHRRDRGQALVEFSLVIVVALMVLMGALDLGRAVYGLSTLSNATREGGRTAVVDQYVPNIQARTAGMAIALGVNSGTVTCSPSPGTATNPPTPTGPSGVCVDFRSPDLSTACASASIGCIAVVTGKWTFTPLTPIIGQFIGPIALTSTTRLPIESQCASSGCPVP